MSEPLFHKSSVETALAALRTDLIHDDGPRISTMRNYRFAILQYDPKDELTLRAGVQRLIKELTEGGWLPIPIDLSKLLFERVRAQGEDVVERMIEMERGLTQNGAARGLNYLGSKLTPLIEGPDGIAADCRRRIAEHVERHPDHIDRSVAIIGRAGALFPFFRSSQLLRHIDGHTKNVPVVLLYPGERRGKTGLSFMGVIEPDHDYRPRIYP